MQAPSPCIRNSKIFRKPPGLSKQAAKTTWWRTKHQTEPLFGRVLLTMEKDEKMQEDHWNQNN